MCLVKNKKHHPFNRPLIAKEDIVCYKHLLVGRDQYLTPVTNVVVPVECVENKGSFKAEIIHKIRFFWRHILGFSNIVEDGFIHTYKYPKRSFCYGCFTCIIPKGAKYFVGEDGVDYASSEIIFL